MSSIASFVKLSGRHCRLWLSGLAVLVSTGAFAQPDQKPLLSTVSGAKPNLMVTLDNSGSMGYTYHEAYGVLADVDTGTFITRCIPGSNGYPAHSVALLNGRGSNTPSTTNVCIRSSDWTWVAGSAYTIPRRVFGSWSAQRSPEVNPVYYNPSIRYAVRKNASGNDVPPTDTIKFLSNETSTHMAYEYRSDSFYYHSTLSTNDNTFFPMRTGTQPSSAPAYGVFAAFRIPKHTAYTTTTTGNPFTSVRCTKVMTNPLSGLQDGCEQFSTTKVYASGNIGTSSTTCTVLGCTTSSTTTRNYIDIPAGNSRTDCVSTGVKNRCSSAEEITNILNWYRYYFDRQEAATTAIGQALANPDLDKELRIGYMLINRKDGSAMNLVPGVDTANTDTLRGVRLLSKGSADNTALYSWLYGQVPRGGTPLHNALDKVAQYYRATTTGVRENPWSKNPSTTASPTTNPEMSCRRSFNLLFSDGAWNAATSTNTGENKDSENGPTFSRTLADGSTETFRYLYQGIDSSLGRKLYIPYPGDGTGGLADLTAKYYWHEDLRTGLDNGIVTRAGQPAFWQNVTTYTVGYQIAPTSPLTFDQIKHYQTDYLGLSNLLGGLTFLGIGKPSWPTGNLASASIPDTSRVNDFIQAGFTGGGRGFSARSSDEVRDIFNTILSEILNSSGNDAGVAVSGSGTGASTSTVEGRVKYSVSYQTIDNTGDIQAQELDENGAVESILWTASNTMPTHDKRNVFSITDDTTPFEFKGRLDSLPTDVQAALKTGSDNARLPSDASFVNYLRGQDPVQDVDGQTFRVRSSPLGAMVNPPSMYMGGNMDLIYDLSGNVTGASDYKLFAQKKRSFPASLYVATNAGVMHAFKAEDGTEMAGYMPRRSLRRMLDYANSDYDFQYVLDGPISENDLYVKDAADDTKVGWQHFAIGTGGRGERLVYAIRAPLNGELGETSKNRTPNKDDFYWETGPEKANDTNVNMGYITTTAGSGQMENGDWVVIVPSGHYNGVTNNKKHGLIVLNASTGALLKNVALPGSYETGRGLGGVTLIRKDKRIVGAYAGDANGNLWRFDLRGNSSNWKVAYNGTPLFTAKDNRPIYTAPAFEEHPEGGNIVVFATGILLQKSDQNDVTKPEAIYGIWDPTPTGKDDVSPFSPRQETKLVVQTLSSTKATSGIGEYYKMSENKLDWSKDQGWTFKLGSIDKGERSLGDRIQNVSGSVFLSTTAITDSAEAGEEICKISDLPVNYLYILDALSGTLGTNGKSFDILDKNGDAGSDGKGDGFVVSRISSGGFSRGVVLPPVFKVPPPPDPECEGDSCVCKGALCEGWRDDDIRKYLDGAGPNGEDTANAPCGVVGSGPVQGTNTKSAGGIYDNCPSPKGWSRTQIQLSAPPAK